ncbi:MAG: TGS domain-containing protein, partial [Candidatus Thermoplasmatota archaeon]|nr:TGS domain-containing protein [Candidatus Thermoplasmatota archaeon]
LSTQVQKISKPMLIAFNKSDCASDEMMAKMKELKTKGYVVVPTSAEAELALTNASKKGLIDYTPGSNNFSIVKKVELSDKQQKALNYIETHVLQRFGFTGIQQCIEEAVRMLDLIVVYPVEDETHLTDKEGRVLPDAYLMKKGSTAKDLAYKVHTDLGDHFIRAVDAKTHRVVGSDYVLQDSDVIRIVADS